MDPVLILIAVAVVALIVVLVIRGNRNRTTALADAQADARAAIDRLAGQVNNLVGSNDAARQALADAGERYTAAGAQVGGANTPAQARLAKQTALEGLYYARAARVAMDLDPGPPIPELDGQRTAGAVTEDRTVDVDGRALTASPSPSDRTPNYYPGGTVAGRPVPAGWYSEPWWKPALVAGAWGTRLIRSWDEQWMELPLRLGDRLVDQVSAQRAQAQQQRRVGLRGPGDALFAASPPPPRTKPQTSASSRCSFFDSLARTSS